MKKPGWEQEHFRGIRVGHVKHQLITILLHDINYYKPIIEAINKLRLNAVKIKMFHNVLEGKNCYRLGLHLRKTRYKKRVDKETAHNIR